MSNRAMGESRDRVIAVHSLREHLGHFGKRLSDSLQSSTNQHFVALLVLPIMLIWINNTIIFTRPIGIDLFLYSGFHLHLPEFLRSRFADTYYAARLPWNALGYAAHRLFDAEHALYVEHLFIFYIAAFSLYSAVSTVFANRSAAFAATMLLGTNGWFLLAIGWDYVDGSYVACLLLSLAMMAGAAFWGRWRIAAIGWGAAVALMVSLYVLWAILVPIEIGMFLCLNRLGRRRNIYMVAVLASFAAVATMASLGGISWLMGGKLLYLMPQIKIMPAVAANQFRYDMPLSKWVWRAEFLLIPGAVWVFSAIWTVLGARPALRKLQSTRPEPDENSESDVNGPLWIACVFCFAGFLLFVALRMVDFHLLEIPDKVNALVPFVFVVLGGALAAGRREPSQYTLLYTLTVIAVTLAPWVASGFDLIAPQPRYFTGPVAVICWIGAGFLVLWIPFVSSKLKYLLVTLFFSIVGFGSASNIWLSFPPDPFYKQAKLAVLEASREISPYNPEAAARFWFAAAKPEPNPDEFNGLPDACIAGREPCPRRGPVSDLLRDVVSTYLSEYSLLNENFPSLTSADGRISSIAPGDRVIILTSGEDPLSAANSAIAGKHLVFREVASKLIRRGEVAFRFVVAEAEPTVSTGVDCGWSFNTHLIDKIPLGSLQPQHGGSIISAQESGVVLTTPRQQWAYAASAPLPLADHTAHPGLVCVRLQVDEGKLGIGVFAHGDPSQMLTEQPVGVTSTPVDIELELAGLANAGSIVLRSWSPNGVMVKARIYSIEVRTGRAK